MRAILLLKWNYTIKILLQKKFLHLTCICIILLQDSLKDHYLFAHGDDSPELKVYRARLDRKTRVRHKKLDMKGMKEKLFNEAELETSENDVPVICDACPYVAKNENYLMMHREVVHETGW